MAEQGTWGFYGRQHELGELTAVFDRRRWFFVKLTGRRRIGKTTLIQRALRDSQSTFYVQLPDSQGAGVLSAVADAMETFRISNTYSRPRDLREFAQLTSKMVRDGYVVVLDEFQYVNRAHLTELTSALQAEVDTLSAQASTVTGGLIVLGSLHTEMAALLEDRNAPLYNRTTHEIALTHLDITAVVELIRAHAEYSPERLLFLWNLFEGVPKFYRDCFEQGVLGAERKELLRRIFFESSSPLRYEAENWFLKELRGRYDALLKYIARNPGAGHADLKNSVATTDASDQVGGYIKTLSEKYRMIERKLPIFAKPNARRGRYYIADNFLRAWLAALSNPVAAMNFRPLNELVNDADQKLAIAEGYALEKLAAQLYEERSRKNVGDFSLSRRIEGFWNSPDTEIDLVAIDEPNRRIRFASCKRSAQELVRGAAAHDGHVERFLATFREYSDWAVEKAGIAPSIPSDIRTALAARGHLAQSLDDLLEGIAT
jgi:uncharacterized protein